MALAAAHGQWIKAKQAGSVLGVIAFDMSSAFDTVDRESLLPKMKLLGITGTPLKWFRGYLSGGEQYVSWNNSRSKTVEVKWGVKQGGILSPSLFSVLMADLVAHIGAENDQMCGYADDQALWAEGRTVEEVKTRQELYASKFAGFASLNGLVLNGAKTRLMFGGKVSWEYIANITVSVDGHDVKPTKSLELLGVRFDSNFSLECHNSSLARATRQRANLVARLFRHLPRGDHLRQLAEGLVGGKLGHAIAAFIRPRTEEDSPTSNHVKDIQIALNDVARAILGARRADRIKITDLLMAANIASINHRATFATAINAATGKVKTVMDLPSSSNVVEIGLPESSRSHLFRHASEITRETKGGYLQGRLYIPEVNRPAYMRLSLVPAEICTEHNPFHLHPNLLHINMKTNKKKRNIRDGELPDDVDWCFIFKIEHDDVLRVCPPQNPRHKEPRFHLNPANEQVSNAPDNLAHEEVLKRQSKDKFQATIKKAKGGKVPSQTKADDMYLGPMKLPTEHITTRVATVKDNYIEMGNAGLMLNIITPLQKFSKGGTNLSEVIRQRYFDLNVNGDPLSSKSLTQVEDYYVKKKEDRIKLQQVRLLIELFSVEDGFPFITSASSDIITNSKSKECGPLQLHDINPAISCCECETKVFMLSFFKLVSGIRANFILYNPEKQSVCYDEHDELFKKLVQPPAKDCQVFNQCVVTCKVPKQDYRVIEEIERHGLQLRLTAFRPSDRKMSNTSFNFKYLKHGHYAPGEPAILDTCEGVCKHFDQHKEVSQELPIAKPGVIRRHPTNQLVPNEVLNQSNELHDQLEEEEKSGDLEIDTEPYPHPYTIPTIIQHHTRPEVLPRPFASHVPKKRPYHEPRAVEEGFYRVNDVVDMKVEQNQILAHAASDNLVLPVPLKKMFMAKAHQGTAISVKEEGNEEEDYDSP
eukprot:maker-scaffold412_size179788-snap-gene-0.19 protein:Tk11831 transcript:maker-scaffold412_size179788-snap-gene-0.19-mRNA-1 annotation:"reverse transcriptase-like protein"